jgi:hypothetical protein
MGFRKDRTTSANTAIMTAGGIVSSLIEAGKVTTLPKAAEAFELLFDAALAKATPVVDADNALFAEVEAAEAADRKARPAAKASSGTKSSGGSKKSGGGQKPQDAGGTLTMNSGPFKGETIEDIYGLDEDTAKDNFGYTRGAGSAYVEYLSTDENPNEYTRAAAGAFLEQVA